jgi:two-component system chemotaxis sensor kinase CheA
MDLSQYMDIFLIEAREHLLNLNQSLLELEGNPQNTMLLDEIFRSAHTLKGMSATMGFEKIADLTHVMENVLSSLRTHDVVISGGLIDILFQCLDALQNMVDAIESGKVDNLPITELIQNLQEVASGSQVNSQSTVEVAKAIEMHDFNLNEYDRNTIKQAYLTGYNVYHVRVEVQPNSLMKSVRAYMVFKNLEELGEIIKSVPSAKDLEEDRFESVFDLLLVTQESETYIAQKVNTISEVVLIGCTILENQTEEKPTIKADEPNRSVSPELKHDPIINEQVESVRQPSKSRQTVRVDLERLDNLMNLVGELVINKTRLAQIGRANNLIELSETVEQFDRISTDLQTLVMKVRMVPVEQVFNRFPRMVRDLAKDLGKEVKFVIEGKETELDRTVIDEIGDPLVHLLRNSLDHGIENSATRRTLGKSLEGLVRLAARHEGNSVIIEIEDDGQGINVEKVRNRAIQLGLIGKETDHSDENLIISNIFQSGFSTADQVTELSGRGVGLDVVRSKIESLSGTITVDNKFGQGSKFKIRLPLTLAIIQALLVTVGMEIYAIPLGSVDETMVIFPKNIKMVQDQEVVLLRGKVLPIIRLNWLLGIPDSSADASVYHVVVVRKGDKQVGLVVDSLIGQQEIVIKPLGKLFGGINGLTGATILGDGQVSLILDIGTLF